MITDREKEILNKISFGLTTIEIANQLCLSTHTVLSHRRHLLQKMDANNTASLIRKGFEYGILAIPKSALFHI